MRTHRIVGLLVAVGILCIGITVVDDVYVSGRVADPNVMAPRPASSLDPLRFPISQQWAIQYGKDDQSQRDYNDFELRQRVTLLEQNIFRLGNTVAELLADANGVVVQGSEKEPG